MSKNFGIDYTFNMLDDQKVMSKLFVSSVVIALFATSASALSSGVRIFQGVTKAGTGSIGSVQTHVHPDFVVTLSEGQVFRLKETKTNPSGLDSASFLYSIGAGSYFADAKNISSAIYGPTTIGLRYTTNYNAPSVNFYIAYVIEDTRVVDKSTTSQPVIVPAQAGPYSVTLEHSTDLLNWSAVVPGSYLGAETLSFFRVRLVKE
jgi:hypothetical protein